MTLRIEIDGDGCDLIPNGIKLSAEVSLSRAEADLKAVHDSILFLNKEAAELSGFTSAERVMNERLNQIEKKIVSGLPAEVKLAIANKGDLPADVRLALANKKIPE